MIRHPYRLLSVVLFLGWAFDFLFWKKPVGLNFAIFVVACLVGGMALLLSNGIRPSPRSLLLLLPTLFFTALTFIRQEPLTLFLAYTLSFISLGLFAVTYLGGRWFQYSLLDLIWKYTRLIIDLIPRPIIFMEQVQKDLAEHPVERKRLPVAPVMRGLAIALPIVFVFGTLLRSADMVFNQKLIDIFKDITYDKISEDIFQIILGLGVAYLLASVYLHAATRSQDNKLLGEDKPVIKQFLGFTETSVVLISVIGLFAIFVGIQFRYFFGGNANIGVQGFTFSEYARRGFNELVTVGFLSLLLILGLSTITKRETENQRRGYSGMSIALVALVIVMLVSAYYRLSLAIEWHGFSRLRLYPRVFLIWVGILFVVVVALEVFRKERYFAFAALLASFGFAATLALLNVDAQIVHYNVWRATQGRHFNVYHLTSLSLDAIPALTEEYSNKNLSAEIHEGIGAALLCYSQTMGPQIIDSPDWRASNFSQTRAKQEMLRVESELRPDKTKGTFAVGQKEYTVNVDVPSVRVRTPGGIWYECSLTE